MNPLARKRVETMLVEQLRLHGSVGATPNMRDIRIVIACSAAELAAAVSALRYQGKVQWDRLELSSSMLAGEEPAPETAGHPVPAAEGGGDVTAMINALPPSIAPRGPDDEDDEDYPGGVNDRAASAPEAGGGRRHNAHGHDGGFVPKRLLHAAGVHGANTRAAEKPLPVPAHEPEIARMVREEVDANQRRRRLARSTATVRQPLEIRKFGIPDLDASEAIGCLLTEEPIDVLRAVSRKHPAMWRRCVLLARQRGERPIQTLYAALGHGLDELEPQQEQAA